MSNTDHFYTWNLVIGMWILLCFIGACTIIRTQESRIAPECEYDSVLGEVIAIDVMPDSVAVLFERDRIAWAIPKSTRSVSIPICGFMPKKRHEDFFDPEFNPKGGYPLY